MAGQDGVFRYSQLMEAKRSFFVVEVLVLTAESAAKAMNAASMADRVVEVISG